MTYPKSSQTINKPKTHKNKINKNSKNPLNKETQFTELQQDPKNHKWKGKRRKGREGNVAL